jgi:multidrug efflux pump subunit AcrB
MAHLSDEQRIRTQRNTARFFTQYPLFAWLLLAATLAWGVFGYLSMPKRKDPDVPIRIALVVCAWPGMSSEKIEQQVTRRIEDKLAENAYIDRLDSTVRTSVSVTQILLREVDDLEKELDDLKGKLDAIEGLPEGAGPVVFLKDFRDTASLMLTVSSPPADPIQVALRARSVEAAITAVRAGAPADPPRVSLVVAFPAAVEDAGPKRLAESLAKWLDKAQLASDVRVFNRPGFVGVDGQTSLDDAALRAAVERFAQESPGQPGSQPDAWSVAIVRDPKDTEARLLDAAGARYSHRELDDYTELLQKALLASPHVARVSRFGVQPEAIYLTYSQERLASYGLSPSTIRAALAARNIALPGGIVETGDRNLLLVPSGELTSHEDLGRVMLGSSPRGSPLYLRDLFEISRDYQSPPRYENTYSHRDAAGAWRSDRAVTLAIMMRSGAQIAEFGAEVDRVLASTRSLLPSDLVVSRTSDQPLQVKESVDLFTRSLWEAVLLVVLISFIGFWEWRSAALIALSIPLTLAMTFGMMHALGIDLQQVSIASLIIALGLLVDDPVVAGDAIQREIARGRPAKIAAWLGPTKLANAIVFATLTNIAAYLPFLTLSDTIGDFLYSLPVVLTCSLVASRVVSMTFVPLLSLYLFRHPRAQRGPGQLAARFNARYRRLVGWVLDHRKPVMLAFVLSLAAGGWVFTNLKTSFFPKDLSYLFYVDVWATEDAPLSGTRRAAAEADAIIARTAEAYGRAHPGKDGKPRDILRSVTSFVGGGGPRFWFSVFPEQQQLNYAQLVVQVNDKHDTEGFVVELQRALSDAMVGVQADVRQLETGEPVGVPVSIRFSGLESQRLREIAERAKGILRGVPTAERVRDDWGAETLTMALHVDPDRANLSGVTNQDVALSAISATNGLELTSLKEGNKQIPVVLRMHPEERADVGRLQDLYVYSYGSGKKVPLRQVASTSVQLQPERIRRRNHFETITVSAFPVEGVLPSEVLGQAKSYLEALAAELPPGYRMEIGGEDESQRKGFMQVSKAMAISILLIYLVLAFEFRNPIKPLIVFAAIPFGVVGALFSLWIAGVPFGFMAFLGVASLVGVIVSHVVVLFDFIEESREHGQPLRESLIEAGIVRLRPVLVTVGATVIGLVPLARNGGPLWEPLCYAQIGGLTVATVVTLVLVPVIYAIFVLDLRIVPWTRDEPHEEEVPSAARLDAA